MEPLEINPLPESPFVFGTTEQKYACPECSAKNGHIVGQILKGKFQIEIDKKNKVWVFNLECGHTVQNAAPFVDTLDTFLDSHKSLDGKQPFAFQKEGIKFAMKAGLRCLIADEMGLGKTIQAILSTLAAYRAGMINRVLCITKAGIKIQISREFMRWSNMELLAHVISGPNQKPIDGFAVTVMSYDMTWRMNWSDEIWDSFDMIILDEVQMVKAGLAGNSKRGKFLLDKASNAKYVLELSGTPFKNNLPEYYNALHILRPDRFSNFGGFVRTYTDPNSKLSRAGLRKDRAALFNKQTEDIVIRREVDDVMPDMPKVQRNFRYSDLHGKYKESYDRTYQEFIEKYKDEDTKTFRGFNNLLQYITAMRVITSLSKVDSTTELVADYLINNNEKMVIFYHHHVAGTMLMNNISEICKEGGFTEPLQYLAAMSAEERDEVLQKFEKSDARILLASTLAGGEGINLQFCNRMILHERQWNPANESQAEGRFRRIGAKSDTVFADYAIAAGTIDDFFTEIVEKKRSAFKSGMSGEFTDWSESDLMTELMNVLYTKGIKRWQL
jgi:SNF2 family DNA or RNA helicase